MPNSFAYKSQFERIFTENYTRLYYYALHIVNDGEAAKDILNDVFVALWKNIATLEQGTVRAYLMTAVRHRSVDHLRRMVLASQLSDDYLRAAADFYEEYSEEKDRLVGEMLAKLTPPTDGILEMCYLKRMKYAEVAQHLGISVNTVKKHIVKALKTLRTLYQGKMEYPI